MGDSMAAARDEKLATLLFKVGGRLFALPVEDVDQLTEVSACALYALPLADERVEGLINAGGQPVAVLRFATVPRASTDGGAYIIARAGDERFAFRVDELRGVRAPGEDEAAITLRAGELLRSLSA